MLEEPFTKIVIWIRKGITSVGVQANDTDPEFVSVASDDLELILARTPEFLTKARQKWASEPRRPAAAPAEPKSGSRNRTPQQGATDSNTESGKPRLF